MSNVFICVVAMAVGVYTFIKHLNGFNHRNTSAIDAWLVAVGTMGWSLILYGNFGEQGQMARWLGYVLFLVYWVGDNLKIQHHCIRYRRKFRKSIK